MFCVVEFHFYIYRCNHKVTSFQNSQLNPVGSQGGAIDLWVHEWRKSRVPTAEHDDDIYFIVGV